MRFVLAVLFASMLAIAACNDPTSPSKDCYYDKTASSAPGNLVCTPSPVIASEPSNAQ
jgi:hypothetical protein